MSNTNIDYKKIVADMEFAQNQYSAAQDTGIGIVPAKEQMKNVAFNYFGELLEAAKNNTAMAEEIAALNVALEDSDRELAALKAASAAKPAHGKKAE